MLNENQIPVGSIKTFGDYGIPYQVGERIKALSDGDILVNITLVQSGEQTQYRLSRLLKDPDAIVI